MKWRKAIFLQLKCLIFYHRLHASEFVSNENLFFPSCHTAPTKRIKMASSRFNAQDMRVTANNRRALSVHSRVTEGADNPQQQQKTVARKDILLYITVYVYVCVKKAFSCWCYCYKLARLLILHLCPWAF